MAAAKIKLSIEQGATFTKTVTWKTGNAAVHMDLAGRSARLQLREKNAEARIETLEAMVPHEHPTLPSSPRSGLCT